MLSRQDGNSSLYDRHSMNVFGLRFAPKTPFRPQKGQKIIQKNTQDIMMRKMALKNISICINGLK